MLDASHWQGATRHCDAAWSVGTATSVPRKPVRRPLSNVLAKRHRAFRDVAVSRPVGRSLSRPRSDYVGADIGTDAHAHTSTSPAKCFSFNVTTAASSSRAWITSNRSPSVPSPVGRPIRRCSAHKRAAARHVAVVTGTYWSSRVSSSSRGGCGANRSSTTPGGARSPQTPISTARARERRAETKPERPHTCADGKPGRARRCRGVVSPRGLVDDGSAGAAQRHRLKVSDVPLRFIGHVLSSPTIEHRRDARGAFGSLLSEGRLGVLGVSRCRTIEGLPEPT
jgi:hypothetical protein